MTNFARAFGHETTGNIVLGVSDITGNDVPTSSRPPRIVSGDFSSLPFKTIQAAIDALPKIILHRVDITIGSGTFAGFYLMGFSGSSPNANINIIGSHIEAVLSDGASSGTAGTGSISSQISKPTGADDWVVNSLRGLFIKINTGGGTSTDPYIPAVRAISGNRSDAVFFEPISGISDSTSFSIVDSDTTIELSPDVVTSNTCILISGNTCKINLYNLTPTNDGYMDHGVLAENNKHCSINNFVLEKSTPNGTVKTNLNNTFSTNDCVLTNKSGIVSKDDVNINNINSILENGYVHCSQFHNAHCELDAYNCETNALFVEKGNYAAVAVRATDCLATPVKARAIGYFELVNYGLTGENNAGYGFDAFDGGTYDITGANISGSTNDLLIDGTEDTYDELTDNGSIIANNTEIRG